MARKTAAAKRTRFASVSHRAGSSQNGRKSGTHWVEWIMGACAGVIVAGIIGFLGFEAVTRTGGRPDLRLQVVDQRDTGAGTEVVIEVRNDGHATAASVELAGTTNGQSLRQVTLDYVPARSRREVVLILPHGVSGGSLKVEILGYVEP